MGPKAVSGTFLMLLSVATGTCTVASQPFYSDRGVNSF